MATGVTCLRLLRQRLPLSSASSPFLRLSLSSAGYSSAAMARPLVLCGPSGSGKSTVMKKLIDEFPDAFGFSVSHTTRQPRPGEEEGKAYFFVTREKMQGMIGNGDFIENAEFSGNLYGTSKAAVKKVLESGRICILDIDVQGVIQIKRVPDLNPLYVFVKPPCMDTLESRLRDRKTETEESLAKRLATAKWELEYGEKPGNFHLIIVNNDLDTAYHQLKAFVLPEIEKRPHSIA